MNDLDDLAQLEETFVNLYAQEDEIDTLTYAELYTLALERSSDAADLLLESIQQGE